MKSYDDLINKINRGSGAYKKSWKTMDVLMPFEYNNISSDLGGGIAAWNSAKIYFKGGYVQNNTSANNGGGITFGNPGTALYMQGGSVINNRSNAANTYGGLYWGQNATYSYSSGTISGNTPINSNI